MLVCFLERKKLNFSCPPLEQMFFEQCLFDFFTENVQMWIFTHNMFVNLQLHRNSINFLVDLTARKWDLFFLQSRCWESWPKCEKQLKPKETLPRCLSHDFLFGCFMGHLYKSHEDIYVPWDNPRFWSIKSKKKVPASNRFRFLPWFLLLAPDLMDSMPSPISARASRGSRGGFPMESHAFFFEWVVHVKDRRLGKHHRFRKTQVGGKKHQASSQANEV